MENLKTEFEKRGFKFLQLWRNNNFALYQVSDSKDRFYEFIKIRVSKERNFNGKHFEEQEIYPSDNDWGSYGWAYRELDAEDYKHITNKFSELLDSNLSEVFQLEEKIKL